MLSVKNIVFCFLKKKKKDNLKTHPRDFFLRQKWMNLIMIYITLSHFNAYFLATLAIQGRV